MASSKGIEYLGLRRAPRLDLEGSINQREYVVKKHIGMIWAQSLDAVIGVDGKIPWSIPDDTKYFKEQTEGCTVVMGRKTWESLPDAFRPLPGRDNVVVTSERDFTSRQGVAVARSIGDAIRGARTNTVWIIGGERMYAEGMLCADELVVTTVDTMCLGGDVPKDFARAPHIYGHHWNAVWSRRGECSSSGLTYTIRHWMRAADNPRGAAPH